MKKVRSDINALIKFIKNLAVNVYYFLKFILLLITLIISIMVPFIFYVFIVVQIAHSCERPKKSIIRAHIGTDKFEYVDTTKMCPTNKSDRFTVVAKSGYEPKHEDTCSVCHHPFTEHSLSDYQIERIRKENEDYIILNP